MSIDPSPSVSGQTRWVVYLVSPEITITSRYVDTPAGRFPIAELEQVVRRINPRLMELVAVYQGEHVVLYSSSVHSDFERVRRAMIRAVEINREPRP